jgi:hypothetical protein
MKRVISMLAVTAALTTSLVTAPVAAQQRQSGLVNVQVGDITTGDILSDIDVNVGVGLNLAANVCGVAVGVLASQLGQTGVAQCDNGAQEVTITRL